MLTLSVSRTSLGLVPLTAADVTQSGATIMDWSPGLVVRDTTIVRSKWADGGIVTHSRDDVVTMTLSLFLRGGSLAASRALAEVWVAALGQFDYTITETLTGGSRAFAAMPASVDISSNPNFWRNGIVPITATIPRNPWP